LQQDKRGRFVCPTLPKILTRFQADLLVSSSDLLDNIHSANKEKNMLGEKLMKLRRKQGYSQQDVALLLGVSRQTISNWESDQGAPSLDKAAELATLYKIKLNDLVSDDIEVVIVDDDSQDQESNLHVLESLIGKTCYIGFSLDKVSKHLVTINELDWFTNNKASILDASSDWIKVEYQRIKDTNLFKKEAIIQLIETSAISGFTIVEEHA